MKLSLLQIENTLKKEAVGSFVIITLTAMKISDFTE
jgi:hypothetical protein